LWTEGRIMNKKKMNLKKLIFCFSLFFFMTLVNLQAEPHSVVEQTQIGDEDLTISLDLKDAELLDVLRTISKVSGLNIVASDEVKGKVTARFDQVKVFEALSTILRSCGYGYIKEGDVIRVMKVDPELLGIDRRTPLVLIQSKIVEVTLDKSHQMGVNWQKLGFNWDEEDVQGEAQTFFPQDENGLTVNIFDRDVDLLLKALSTETQAEILSQPKIVALDDKEAKILVGEKVAYQQSFGQAAAGITTTSILFEDVGIELTVTPHVRGDDFIIMGIHSEVSAVKEWRTLSNGDEVPIISTKQTDTEVMIKDKSTLVIGGLVNTEKRESVSKIPILGNLPVISFLFKYKRTEDIKKELLVFITPQLISKSE
jgi:type II secretory pathway component GspD/PulD (secretin)